MASTAGAAATAEPIFASCIENAARGPTGLWAALFLVTFEEYIDNIIDNFLDSTGCIDVAGPRPIQRVELLVNTLYVSFKCFLKTCPLTVTN